MEISSIQRKKQMKKWLLAAILAVLTLSAHCAVASSKIAAYANPAIYPLSADFSLSVDGTRVPVTAFQPATNSSPEYSYAHFSFSGSPTLTVTASSPVSTFRISPLALRIAGTARGNTLRFVLTQSRYLIVKINTYAELIIAADALETNVPAAKGAGIFNVVTGYGADASGAAYSTSAIQSAVNAAAVHGGTVYVPDGVYKIGNLVLKSNVTLYLTGGAVLRGSGLDTDYKTSYHKDSLSMNGTWLISTAPNSTNITIRGRGTIDGQGILMRTQHSYLNNLIMPLATSHFTIDGITGRDAGLWSLTPTRSSHVTIANYKGLQSLNYREDDAMDINECQFVTVQHTLAVSWDDTYSTKTWEAKTDIAAHWPGSPQPLRQVLFSDAVAWTHCVAFKIGYGAFQPQQNVTYQYGFVYDASHAYAVDPRGATAQIDRLKFLHSDVENISYANDGGSYWLRITASGENAQNITLQDINVRSKGASPSVIAGASGTAKVINVQFDNVVVNGVRAGSVSELGADANSNVSGLAFR